MFIVTAIIHTGKLSSVIFSDPSQIPTLEITFMGLNVKDLLIGNYMTAYPTSVKPAVPFKTVINFMAEKVLLEMVKKCVGKVFVCTRNDKIFVVISKTDIIELASDRQKYLLAMKRTSL